MAGLHFVLGKIQEEQASPLLTTVLLCTSHCAHLRMLETYYTGVVCLPEAFKRAVTACCWNRPH